MPLQKPFPYGTSFGIHLLIALILGTILSFILIVLEPVGISEMDGFFGKAYKLGYGISIASGYLISHFLANQYFSRTGTWTWGDEVVFEFASGILGISLAYLYHDYVINGQPYSIIMYLGFLLYLALPIFPLLVGPTLFLRYYLVKSPTKPNKTGGKEISEDQARKYLHLTGDNQKDELIVAKEKIVYVKSVENYIQLFYFDKGKIMSKIFRGTLSDVHQQAAFLVQAHRSYLINSAQPYKLRGNSQKAVLRLENLGNEIPVSRSNYSSVKKALSSIPKG